MHKIVPTYICTYYNMIRPYLIAASNHDLFICNVFSIQNTFMFFFAYQPLVACLQSDCCMLQSQHCHDQQLLWMQLLQLNLIIRYGNTVKLAVWTPLLRRKGDRGRRTSEWAKTQDQRSITEFYPCEPLILITIPHPQLPLYTGHG